MIFVTNFGVPCWVLSSDEAIMSRLELKLQFHLVLVLFHFFASCRLSTE